MAVNGFLVDNEVQKYNYESLENYNTPDFSTSLTYQVGDYVMYQGKLYRCTTEITTSGAWDSSKWILAILSDDVTNLRNSVESGEYGLSELVKQAILQIARKVAYIDDQGQTYYDALYDALYPLNVASISAVYTQSGTVYNSDSLDSLKADLVVTATYSDSSTATVAAANYTLSGVLTVGTSTITVSYGGKTTTFTVNVTAAPVLSSISAVYANASANIPITSSMKRLGYINTGGVWTAYAQSFSLAIPATVGKAYKLSWNETDEALVGNYFRWGFCDTDTPSSQTLTAWNRGWTPQNCNEVTVIAVDDFLVVNVLNAVGDSVVSNGYLTVTEYTNSVQDLGTLDPLTSNLVVTATYTGGATEIIPSTDYTLSGTLNTGENTITVTYGGKTDTFTAIVAAPLYSIPDFSATTQGSLTVSKTSGVYSISGAGNGVAYINPEGTVSTSKSDTVWFIAPASAPLSNYAFDSVWNNPTSTDTNLAVKFAQASATGNLYTAEVPMAKNSSGTNGSGEFTFTSIGGATISSLGLQFTPSTGSGSPSATCRIRLVIDGVRYL